MILDKWSPVCRTRVLKSTDVGIAFHISVGAEWMFPWLERNG